MTCCIPIPLCACLPQIQELSQAVSDFRTHARGRAPTVAYADCFGEGGMNATSIYMLASTFGQVTSGFLIALVFLYHEHPSFPLLPAHLHRAVLPPWNTQAPLKCLPNVPLHPSSSSSSPCCPCQVYLQPSGLLSINGLETTVLFFKGLFDKLKVGVRMNATSKQAATRSRKQINSRPHPHPTNKQPNRQLAGDGSQLPAAERLCDSMNMPESTAVDVTLRSLKPVRLFLLLLLLSVAGAAGVLCARGVQELRQRLHAERLHARAQGERNRHHDVRARPDDRPHRCQPAAERGRCAGDWGNGSLPSSSVSSS